MKKLLFALLVLATILSSCVKIEKASGIRGVVFTDENIHQAEIKLLDFEGNQLVSDTVTTDRYGRFSIGVPAGIRFPVVIVAAFDSTCENGEKDYLASVVEETFCSELISVNPVTSVFTAYMFKTGVGYSEAVRRVREAFGVPEEVNLLSQLHPNFETSYFSMAKLAAFVRENFACSYQLFSESIVNAIVSGSTYGFGAEALLELGISDILKEFLKEIGGTIHEKAKDEALSWILKSLFGLGDKSEELIREVIAQIREVNKKLDDVSNKLNIIDTEIQDILEKLDEQYYDSYIRTIDQNYFTPVEACQNKYIYITTLEATHMTDVSIQELMDEIKDSKLDQVMLNIKKVIVGGTAETSYKSIFELYVTNALNMLRREEHIDEYIEERAGFYNRCSWNSEIFTDYVNTYINLFKAMTTRQLYALNLLVEYEHYKDSNLAELHLEDYNSYIAAEVEEFWKWLEIFITYAIGGDGLMISPKYDADKAWFYNQADAVALKALGNDTGIVVRLFWNSGETMDLSIAGDTPDGLETAFGFLSKAYESFRGPAGIKLTLDNQQIKLSGMDEAIEASDPTGKFCEFTFTYQDEGKSKEPLITLRRYVFENLDDGRYSISESTNGNIVQTTYSKTLLEEVHKNIANDHLIAVEYLDGSNYALDINSETSQVRSLAISAYTPSMRINGSERQMTYGRSHNIADHDYVGVLSYPLNRYMKIEGHNYYEKTWILFIPHWSYSPFDAVIVDGTNRETSGRYSSRLILTNKGDNADGDAWGWQQGVVSRTHPVWLRATNQLSSSCLAPYDLSGKYSISKKEDQYRLPSTVFSLYLNKDTSHWDLYVEPSGINILGMLFGGDSLYYGEIVALKNIHHSQYISYTTVNRQPDLSNYTVGALSAGGIYDMKNWWIFLR